MFMKCIAGAAGVQEAPSSKLSCYDIKNGFLHLDNMLWFYIT